jgi:hypothetical protein
MIKSIILLLFLTFTIGALAAPAKGVQNFFKDKTKIDNPFNLRDPFKAPVNKSEGKKQGRGFTITGKGQYSNIGDAALDQITVDSIKVVGVLIGKERRALVHGGKDSKKIIILKEGVKIGPEAAELKAILPGGIVLVEKIVNVYGEEEFLETVIPISK